MTYLLWGRLLQVAVLNGEEFQLSKLRQLSDVACFAHASWTKAKLAAQLLPGWLTSQAGLQVHFTFDKSSPTAWETWRTQSSQAGLEYSWFWHDNVLVFSVKHQTVSEVANGLRRKLRSWKHSSNPAALILGHLLKISLFIEVGAVDCWYFVCPASVGWNLNHIWNQILKQLRTANGFRHWKRGLLKTLVMEGCSDKGDLGLHSREAWVLEAERETCKAKPMV